MRAYDELFTIAKGRLDRSPDDQELEKQTLEYLKGLVTRSDTDDLIHSSLEMCEEIIRQRGQLSELSREARYYMGELYYLRKDFSTAAKTFRDFIRIYGPKQDAEGRFADGPWKPETVDDRTVQLHEAALRVAHCCYLRSHHQNMIAAYRWIARNMPEQNPTMAEVNYWLAMELGKGKEGQTAEAKRKLAEALWTGVVDPSLDVYDKDFEKEFHPWVTSRDPRYPDVERYVKTAMLRSADLFGQVKQHELAAAILEQYLRLYLRAERNERLAPGESPDELYDVAHYALGRQYIALDDTFKLLSTYLVYATGIPLRRTTSPPCLNMNNGSSRCSRT